MASGGRPKYSTPQFSPSDPLVCRSIQLRPSIWAVVFAELQWLGSSYAWRQDDPANATVSEVITEINNATDAAVFAGCYMIGQVIELVTNDVPAWVLPCDGTEYLGSDYPELWAVIHDNLKTDGTHFRTPDRNRRIAWGETVGAQEGSEEHTLTVVELPAHNHYYNTVTFDFIELEAGATAFARYDVEQFDTGETGNDTPHSILNPVEGTQYFIVASTPQAG